MISTASFWPSKNYMLKFQQSSNSLIPLFKAVPAKCHRGEKDSAWKRPSWAEAKIRPRASPMNIFLISSPQECGRFSYQRARFLLLWVTHFRFNCTAVPHRGCKGAVSDVLCSTAGMQGAPRGRVERRTEVENPSSGLALPSGTDFTSWTNGLSSLRGHASLTLGETAMRSSDGLDGLPHLLKKEHHKMNVLPRSQNGKPNNIQKQSFFQSLWENGRNNNDDDNDNFF